MKNSRLSPDELDLDRSELSDDEWKDRLEQLESDPDLAREIIESLSEHQKTVLTMALDRGGKTHSGRGGWDVRTMHALEKKGLVLKGKQFTWDTNWSLTTRGMSVGRMLARQRKENPRT